MAGTLSLSVINDFISSAAPAYDVGVIADLPSVSRDSDDVDDDDGDGDAFGTFRGLLKSMASELAATIRFDLVSVGVLFAAAAAAADVDALNSGDKCMLIFDMTGSVVLLKPSC